MSPDTINMAEGKPAPASHRSDSSPWRFLGPLTDTPADRELLALTRDNELGIVERMALASHASILYASSGNGKTSLIEAGVIPALRARGVHVFKTRPRPPGSVQDPTMAFKLGVLEGVPQSRKAEDMLVSLAKAERALSADASRERQELAGTLGSIRLLLAKALSNAVAANAQEALRASLGKSIVDFMRDVCSALGIRDRVVVICDQFEEVFVHHANTPTLTQFVEELGALWAARRPEEAKVHLLFSMREDWVGSMIEFREAIPDIFNHFYKLNPLSQSEAKLVLRAAFKASGIVDSNDIIDRITADLALLYRQIQTQPFGDVNLARTPEEDPYVEAPALQVVADALWNSRHKHEKPFGEQHYAALAGGSPANGRSPAACVLDNYVPALLEQAGDTTVLTAEQLRDLRVECLYAMTDGRRHRRAVRESDLVQFVSKAQRGIGGAPEITTELIRQAIGPLIEARLVRAPPGTEQQLELAHDFAVRSVVACWRALDRRRAEEEAIRRRVAVTTEAVERGAVESLRAIPYGCYLTLLIAAFYVGMNDKLLAAPCLWGAVVLLIVMTGMGLVRREKAIVSVGVCGALAVGTLAEAVSRNNLSGAWLALSLLIALSMLLASASLDLALSRRFPSFVLPEPARRFFADLMDTLAFVLLFGVIVVLTVKPVADLLELVFNRIGADPSEWAAVVVTSFFLFCVVLASAVMIGLAGARSTIGTHLGGLQLVGDAHSPPTRGMLVRRQLLFVPWALANIVTAFLPWLILREQHRRKRNDDYQFFYDRVAGTRLSSA